MSQFLANNIHIRNTVTVSKDDSGMIFLEKHNFCEINALLSKSVLPHTGNYFGIKYY